MHLSKRLWSVDSEGNENYFRKNLYAEGDFEKSSYE